MFRKLRGILRENDIDQSLIADRLGICPMAISHRMTGRTDWKLSEMYMVLDLIGAGYDQLSVYFPKQGKIEAEMSKKGTASNVRNKKSATKRN